LIFSAELLNQYFERAVKLKADEPKPDSVLNEVSFDGIVEYIKSGKCKKIVTIAGAGISTCNFFS